MRGASLGMIGLLLGVSCAPTLVPPSGNIPRDDRPLPAKPRVRDPSLANEILEMTFGYQLWQVFDTPRLTRKLVGRPYQARNVDGFDEVPDNSWFTNRNARRPLSNEEIKTGPNVTGPPAAGRWRVVGVKSEGVTPGMTIVDRTGRRYIIKFDPPDFPELSSGTECVASRLLHAAGYNVPENYVVRLDPNRLELDPAAVLKVATEDKRDPIEERTMTQADLTAILDRVNPGQGSVRALASLFLPGVPVGPWRYTGVSKGRPQRSLPARTSAGDPRVVRHRLLD